MKLHHFLKVVSAFCVGLHVTLNVVTSTAKRVGQASQEQEVTRSQEPAEPTAGSAGRLLDMFDAICAVTGVRPQLTSDRGQLVVRNEATANVWKFRAGTRPLHHHQRGHPAIPDAGLTMPDHYLVGMPLYSGHDPRIALRSPAEPDRAASLPVNQRQMTPRPVWEIFFWLIHLGDGYLTFSTSLLAGERRTAIGFGSGRRSGAPVTSGTWLDSPALQFHLRLTANGNLTIVNRESGHCLADRDTLLSRPVSAVVCNPTDVLQFWQLCDPTIRRCWPRDVNDLESKTSLCSVALPQDEF